MVFVVMFLDERIDDLFPLRVGMCLLGDDGVVAGRGGVARRRERDKGGK
jgi:hypothetical protein